MLRCLQVDFRVMSNDATSTGKLSQLHWCYAACHLTGTYTRTQGVQNTQRHQQPCLLLMKLSSPLNGRKVAIRQRTSVRPTLPKSAPWQQHSNRGTLVWTDVLCRDTDRLWKRCDWNNVHRVNIEHLSISIFTCELWKVLLVCSLGMKLNAIRLFGWWPSCLVYTHLQWLPLTFQRDLKALFIACELGSCLISGSPMLYSRKDWITCCRHIFSPSISAGWAFSKLDFIDGALNFWKEMANVVLKQAISSHGLIHLIFDIPMIFPINDINCPFDI